jgi:ubiquitin-protein ligase
LKEQSLLEAVNRDSDYVKVSAQAPVGGAPERYIVTFHCRGIVGIDGAKNPIYGDKHEVEIYCDADFPPEVPRLKWITPIWHPNIRHKEPKDVCVNKHEWLAGMCLDSLCWQMFDMVQYRNYHAEPTDPFPLDHEAAEWVLTFAEPRGIVNRRRGISVDNRPFLRGKTPIELPRAQLIPPAPRPRVKFGTGSALSIAATSGLPPGRAAAAQTVGKDTDVKCRSCGATLPFGTRVCGVCGNPLARVRFG